MFGSSCPTRKVLKHNFAQAKNNFTIMVLVSDAIIIIIIISIIKSVLIVMSFSLYGSNITETGTMKKPEITSYCRICKECVSSCKGTIIIIV